MGLQLNVSNSLYQLVDHLCDDLGKPLKDVFQPHYIVTQTLGMNNWLKIQLADRLGITANCRFLKPNDMINQLYFVLDGPKEQVLSADNLQWVLFDQLNDTHFKKRFPSISNYYADHDEIKRMALAEQVADLFDQYQVYRPEMIKEWNDNHLDDKNISNWQQYLWIRVKGVLGAKMPDKTTVGKFIVEALHQADKQQKLYDSLSHIHIFGISIITSYHLEVFQTVAQYIDVSFHLLNPAPTQYWFDDKNGKQIAYWKRKRGIENFAPPIEGNALLTHWGRVIQDTFSLFFKNEDFLNRYNDEAVIAPQPRSLLSKIQHDIFQNAVEEDRNRLDLTDLEDGSLTINACYTPAREVEVLYNYLVNLVDQRSHDFSPRDIVVMVSDIDTYAPYIKAIFNAAPYSFPFTIADESIQSSDGLFSALQALMALHEENFKAEEVLQLLELSAIRKRFQITDIELIRKVVRAANIRFGISGSHHDDTITVSWLNGLNRIMYGICMSGGEEYRVEGYGIYPIDMVEGSEATEMIRFCHFVQVLIDIIKEQRRARSLADWSSYISFAVSQLISYSEEEDDEHYQYLLKYLERLNILSQNLPDEISFQVFKHSFLKRLSGEIKAGNFAAGGITFCSLIPMRSIPFKVVALLGMNFDKFPRRESAISFNLMEKHPQRGDRNIKNNDKHLFLETLLSAEEHLYISYIGRSVKNNDTQPPSVLVDELIDYITQDIKEEGARDQLITVHPLHGFSQRYSLINSSLYTYLGEQKEDSANVFSIAENNKEAGPFDNISIHQFINFFKNPFEAYYNRILAVYYRDEEMLLSDTECFALDTLQSWKLKQELLFLDEADFQSYQYKAIKTGLLPLKNMAKIEMEEVMLTVAPIRELLKQYSTGHEEQLIDIELLIEDTLFKGSLHQIFNQQQIFISFSKNQHKYLLEAYIKHLFAISAAYPLDTVFISGSDEQVYTIDRHQINQEEAKRRLKKLLTLYKSGWNSPLMYSPAFENDPQKLGKMDATSFRKDLKDKIAGYRVIIKDPYIKREFEAGFFDGEQIFDQYIINWELIFAPVIDAFPDIMPKSKNKV